MTSDRMTDIGRKADERTMDNDQTPVKLTPVDETSLRSRQSTSRLTVYCQCLLFYIAWKLHSKPIKMATS